MTNSDLSQSYLIKAQKRLKILNVLLEEEDYSDVMRESQEIVELSLKALLRFIGVDVPKIHDVGELLFEFKQRFSEKTQGEIEELSNISKYLMKERELAFYGEIDFIPTEEYTREDAEKAIRDAHYVVEVILKEIGQYGIEI